MVMICQKDVRIAVGITVIVLCDVLDVAMSLRSIGITQKAVRSMLTILRINFFKFSVRLVMQMENLVLRKHLI